ncbi:MAG: hypothetical protein ACSLFF_08770 [Solirubrobacterales bacterium]
MADEEFGITEWGADWVRLAQSKVSAIKRLPQARTYARNDKVEIGDLTARPFTISVEGAQVQVTIPAYTEKQRQRVAQLLAKDADSENQSPGDLSEAFHLALSNAGLDPVPSRVRAVCSCNAAAQPCVHILATYYELSRKLDEQPPLALGFRGFASADATPAAAQRWVSIADLEADDFYRSGAA